jgi:ketosteroid isomerase-like protein
VRRAYDAFGRADIDEFKTLLDDAIEWQIPAELPYGGTFSGPDAVVKLLSAIPDYYLTRNLEITSFDEVGELVIVRGRHFGQVKDGREYDSGFAAFYTVRDGRIVNMREFVDPGKVMLVLDSLRNAE